MSDITERLRDRGRLHSTRLMDIDRSAAADEIDRLRGLLRQVRHHAPLPRGLEDAIDAALRGEGAGQVCTCDYPDDRSMSGHASFCALRDEGSTP